MYGSVTIEAVHRLRRGEEIRLQFIAQRKLLEL